MHKRIFLLVMMVTCCSMVGCKDANTESGSEVNIENQEDVVDKEDASNSSEPTYVEGSKEDFNTHEIDDKSIAITKYVGDKEYLIVPETINGLSVVSVDGFQGNETIKGIILPDTLTTIDDYAFNGCSSLESVVLGNNVEKIGEYAFINCDALSSINLPDSITEIGECAFNVNNLTEITIPSGLTEITLGAFTNGNWEELTIPGTVKIIGDQGFTGNKKIKKVYIEEGVEEIGPNAFDSCDLLEEIHIPASVTTISERSIADNTDILTIYAPAGSVAEAYAKENYYNFVAE